MGQSAFKPIALVVEEDVFQRELAVVFLEESEMGVIECDSAEEGCTSWKGWASTYR